MRSLAAAVAKILAARRARDVYGRDPILSSDDVAYREGRLLSTREWPGYTGPTRPGRSEPPRRNPWEDEVLAKLGKR